MNSGIASGCLEYVVCMHPMSEFNMPSDVFLILPQILRTPVSYNSHVECHQCC